MSVVNFLIVYVSKPREVTPILSLQQTGNFINTVIESLDPHFPWSE